MTPVPDGKIRIDGRDYELPDTFNLGEQRLFKTVGGIRLAELGEALQAGDQDVILVVCMIVKRRAGETCSVEDAEKITTIDFPEAAAVDEGDAVPPPVPVAASQPSEAGGEVGRPPNLEMIRAASGAQS